MKDNDYGDYLADGHNRYEYFKNKHGEEWVYKPPRKAKGKSHTDLVLDYLSDEWGLQRGVLSGEAHQRLMEMIDYPESQGNDPANTAGVVMEMLWQHGLQRPDFGDTN